MKLFAISYFLSLMFQYFPHYSVQYSPPFSAEVKNAWSYTSTPPYAFIAWCLIKYRIRLQQGQSVFVFFSQ
jgi:hypothetical protein